MGLRQRGLRGQHSCKNKSDIRSSSARTSTTWSRLLGRRLHRTLHSPMTPCASGPYPQVRPITRQSVPLADGECNKWHRRSGQQHTSFAAAEAKQSVLLPIQKRAIAVRSVLLPVQESARVMLSVILQVRATVTRIQSVARTRCRKMSSPHQTLTIALQQMTQSLGAPPVSLSL